MVQLVGAEAAKRANLHNVWVKGVIDRNEALAAGSALKVSLADAVWVKIVEAGDGGRGVDHWPLPWVRGRRGTGLPGRGAIPSRLCLIGKGIGYDDGNGLLIFKIRLFLSRQVLRRGSGRSRIVCRHSGEGGLGFFGHFGHLGFGNGGRAGNRVSLRIMFSWERKRGRGVGASDSIAAELDAKAGSQELTVHATDRSRSGRGREIIGGGGANEKGGRDGVMALDKAAGAGPFFGGVGAPTVLYTQVGDVAAELAKDAVGLTIFVAGDHEIAEAVDNFLGLHVAVVAARHAAETRAVAVPAGVVAVGSQETDEVLRSQKQVLVVIRITESGSGFGGGVDPLEESDYDSLGSSIVRDVTNGIFVMGLGNGLSLRLIGHGPDLGVKLLEGLENSAVGSGRATNSANWRNHGGDGASSAEDGREGQDGIGQLVEVNMLAYPYIVKGRLAAMAKHRRNRTWQSPNLARARLPRIRLTFMLKPQYMNLRLVREFSKVVEKGFNRILRDQEMKSME